MSAIYLSCDMEGTAGVCSWKQCDPNDRHEYPVYRRYMTQEVRAAIVGARAAGATSLVVNDSHWSMHNLLWEELPDDDDLRVITGSPKPRSMGQGLDERFDAVFLTGYHAKAGDAAALAHTMTNEVVYSVRVNGTPCSEALIFAALAGSYGVPVVLVTGDRTIVDEVTRVMPWVVGVAVKDSIGYTAVNSLTPRAAQRAIESGAREAMTRIAHAKPFAFDPPYELVVETVDVEHADFIELMPEFARVGPRAVRFSSNDYRTMLRAFIVATRIGAAASAIA
ncbi:MAG TPA: M55 family metallopeptidase [Candidatus Baltobacteraceae bacterium]|nr:M55 family metallopeptidase [Candidatus Baltobacteraceae bacterium]